MHLPLPASILLGEVEEVVDVVEEGVGSICSLIFSRVRTKVAYHCIKTKEFYNRAKHSSRKEAPSRYERKKIAKEPKNQPALVLLLS